jgi:hypothetical protein
LLAVAFENHFNNSKIHKFYSSFIPVLCIHLWTLQQECEYDSVVVHSKMGEDVMRRHGVYCGSRLPGLITSEGNSLRVEFNSDNSVQKSVLRCKEYNKTAVLVESTLC